MTPKIWGPPVWIFLHTFSVNISEYGYYIVGMQFFSYITRICRLLPCPECSEHATKFISSVNPSMLKTKYDMANMLCTFHNIVNSRKKTPIFNHLNLVYYENISIINSFNNFVQAFTMPSQRYMSENLQRKMLISQMNQFMKNNLIYFIKPKPIITPPLPYNDIINEESNQLYTIQEEPINENNYNNITYTVSFVSDSDLSTTQDTIPEKEEDVVKD
jgi:hypothetical protein